MTITTEGLLKQLKTREIAIFGAGFVAEMFWQALKLHGAEDNVSCCVVTHAESGHCFHGIPVRSLQSTRVPENMLLCIAVHESGKEGLHELLSPYEAQTVWIYPYLFELLYGKPICLSPEYPLAELLVCQNREEYWLAVRYAAIRDFLNESPGYSGTKDLYLQAVSLHCAGKTALRRASRMEELALSMSSEGFREDCPVRIDEAGRIIDGLHRIACAAYLKMKTVPALIYPYSQIFESVLGEKNRLPEWLLRRENFSEEHIDYLKEAQNELLKIASGEQNDTAAV